MKQAINTRTQEEYDALMRYYESKGAQWQFTKRKPKEFDVWSVRKAKTCIICFEEKLSHASVEYCRKQSIPVIPYTEFAKANIVEEPDWKTKYEEAVGLLESIKHCEPHGQEQEEAMKEVWAFLTKHNDLTNHKDGE